MRGLFVRMRTALKCNVHGQLFRQGVLLEEESSIFTLKGRAALKRIDMDESERDEMYFRAAFENVVNFVNKNPTNIVNPEALRVIR